VALGNRVLEADALVGLIMAYFLNGDPARAVEAAQLAYAIGQEIQNEFGQCMSRPWLVCGLVDQGAYEEALALTQTNLAIARSQALAPKILATFSAGLLYWALGGYASAQKIHLELMPHLEEASVPGYRRFAGAFSDERGRFPPAHYAPLHNRLGVTAPLMSRAFEKEATMYDAIVLRTLS
jgi:tetratricopeptide (TPR) repeat protein